MAAAQYILPTALSLLLLPYAWSFYTFVHTHLFHRSTIHSFLLSPKSYALVTGASDGIGKGIARELVRRGFNVVIHGRNAQKLERVKLELEALGTGGDVRILVADAGEENLDWAAIDDQLKGLEITVLVNNAGGMPIPPVSFDAQSISSIETGLRLNALFPMRLTHLLLPRLRALPGPAVVLFIGSIASELPPPYMAAYACSKAFVQTLVQSLSFDERRMLHSRVQLHYVQTANVKSNNGVFDAASLSTPDAETYGKCVVGIVGCGSRVVCPWWMHAVQRWVVYSMGEWMSENVLLWAMPKPKQE